MSEFYSVGGREVRRFPKGWQHPRDDRGRHEPLLPANYVFDSDAHRAECGGTMPTTEGLTADQCEVAAYEAVSEGTPITPAFPDSAEGRLALVRHCAEHCTTFGSNRADAEAWAAILFGDAAVGIDGRVVASD